MEKLLMLAALAALVAGCSVTKINYEKDDKGTVSYRIYHNDHWLKLNATGLKGGMTKDGTFEIAADGVSSSPSEEFNKTMKTYTSAMVNMMQIAAAAYNPSASAAAANVSRGDTEAQSASTATSTTAAATATNAVETAEAK